MKILDFSAKGGKINILDLIFPRFCVGCGVEQTWLCEECRAKIIFVKTSKCAKCGRLTKNFALCSRHRPKSNLSRIYTTAYYEEPLKALVHTFKYEFIREIGSILANLIVKNLHLKKEGLIIPVPLSRRELRVRGFNQSAVIAGNLAKLLKFKLESSILLKAKETPPQVGLERKLRIINLRDAFEISKKTKRTIFEKTIYLVDDVMTTGATLEECAKVLKQNGARKVFGIVVARG